MTIGIGRSTLASALVLSALTIAGPARAQPADLVLHNARIHTVDKDFSTAQAVAIRGERFVVVGDSATALKEAGPNTQVIDLGGRTVVVLRQT